MESCEDYKLQKDANEEEFYERMKQKFKFQN